jgi:hypothetical protein
MDFHRLYLTRYNFDKIQITISKIPSRRRCEQSFYEQRHIWKDALRTTNPKRGEIKSLDSLSLRVFISKEQTKETDEGDKSNSVVYGRCVQRPMEASARFDGDVSKGLSHRHCEEERRSNPVIIRHFRIASLRSQ